MPCDEPTATSPFVPRSANAVTDGRRTRPQAINPARMSLPTNPPMLGRNVMGPSMSGDQPSSAARNARASRYGVRNGACARASTLHPQKRWCMAVLPQMRTSRTVLSAARRAAIAPNSVRMRSRRTPGRLVSKPMRLIRSAPWRACGLKAVSVASTSPLNRSTSCAASVVVPRSMAMPKPSRGSASSVSWPVRTGADHCSTSMVTGPLATAKQPRRQPCSISASLRVSRISDVTGTSPETTRTRQLPQSRDPPQGNSTPNSNRRSRKEAPGLESIWTRWLMPDLLRRG